LLKLNHHSLLHASIGGAGRRTFDLKGAATQVDAVRSRALHTNPASRSPAHLWPQEHGHGGVGCCNARRGWASLTGM